MSSSYDHKIAQNYAQALFEVSEQQCILDEATRAFMDIKAALQENVVLKKLMRNPLLTKEDQENSLFQLVPRKTHTLFSFLIMKKKLALLEGISDAFLEKISAYHNRLTVQVETPYPLTQSQRDRLMEKLIPFADSKTLELREEINPHLLGGMRVRFDGKILDLSLLNQTHQITQVNHV